MICSQAKAQWTKQASPVKTNLTAVTFRGGKLGFAAGEKGTLLITKDGGKNWTQLKTPVAENITSVTIIDSSAVMITSNYDGTGAAIYESKDQGQNWVRTLSDTRTFVATRSQDKSLYSTSSHIYKSADKGRNWEKGNALNLTSIYSKIEFSDSSTGFIAGNISGVLQYSTEMLRTADAGNTWYVLDNFSYPNANGYAAENAINKDSVYLFSNFYNHFSPGDSCQLSLLTNFRLVKSLSNYVWKFDSKIINYSFPDRINDCRFFSSGKGYTAGDKGVIYVTSNSGKKWVKDYKGTTPVKAIFMLDEETGYAVGESGLILKRTAAISIATAKSAMDIKVYPNPASSQAYIEFSADKNIDITVNITDAQGNIRSQIITKNYSKGAQKIMIPVSKLQNGLYHVQLVSKAQILASKELVVMH